MFGIMISLMIFWRKSVWGRRKNLQIWHQFM